MQATRQNRPSGPLRLTPRHDARILDYHRALLSADELHRLRATTRAGLAQAFTHLGFLDYFRVELSWAHQAPQRGAVVCARRGSRSGPTPASP
jgi:hypothetical protein